MTDPLFDNVAFSAVERAIHRIQPDASVLLLRITDHSMYQDAAIQLGVTGSVGLLDLLLPLGQVANAPS